MEIQQCVAKMKHLRDEVQHPKVETEHLNGKSKIQHSRDDERSNKSSLTVFHQNV
jgi:hypothetical protein